MAKIPWSWSRLEQFEQCPKLFYHKNILKDVPFVPNEATERGKRVHKALEDAIRDGAPLPDSLGHMHSVVEGILGIPRAIITVEQQVAFDENMVRTGYFDKNVYLRVVMDLVMQLPHERVAHIWDWKTGKVKSYSDQLALSAMAGFALWPDIDRIVTAYVFVDHKHKLTAEFDRSQYEQLRLRFGDRAELINLTLDSGVWNATPNRYCRWCDLSKAQCQYKE